MMMCPWATIEKPEPVSFADIVFEEKIRNIQTKKENSTLDAVKILDQSVITEERGSAEDTSDSDLSDHELKHSSITNEDLQLPLSFDNSYQEVSLNQDFKNDIQSEISYIQDNENVGVSYPLENELISAASFGYKLRNSGKMIVKHDFVVFEKKNKSKLTPKFQITKDCIKEDIFDSKLSYKYFKSLKICFRKEETNNSQMQNKDRSVFDFVPYSSVVLYNLINSGLLESINYVLNLGKGALILHATLDSSSPYASGEQAKKCVIKYFKTEDPEPKRCTKTNRLSEQEVQSETRTKLWWAKQEMLNLMRASMSGVPCPQIMKLEENVLVMSFIGKDRKPAPKLKYAELSYSNFVSAYKQVKDAMKKLYQKVNLIHGDLNEYNILWHNGQCYFIDFNQSIRPSHENAFYILLRDCINITKFFRKKMPDIDQPEELFTFITGFHYGNKIILDHMEKLYKKNPHCFHKPKGWW